MTRLFAAVALLAFGTAFMSGCPKEEAAPPLSSLKPRPLPEVPAETDETFKVEAAPVYGSEVPKSAARLELKGDAVLLEGAPLQPGALKVIAEAKRPVLVIPDADVFLARASETLAALDDAGVSAWLLHPEGSVAYPLTLSDEADYQEWLDMESIQGRLRVIHRADGYELQTHVGKVIGFDPNGPSVPLRGGKWDLARLRHTLGQLRARFENDTDVCIVPSFGMELSTVAASLSAFYEDEDEPFFDRTCLVYPRPH